MRDFQVKAVTYQGYHHVSVKEVPDPILMKEDDILVKVEMSSVCGSDLHLYNGMIPSLEKDYIIGHEAVGTVVEVGRGVEGVHKGDRIVVPFNIACGHCRYCEMELESQCDTANENYQAGAYFGCSRLYGDYDGCQAELVRVPFANYTRFIVPKDNEVSTENLLLLTDSIPTAYWAVKKSGMKPGDTVIVLGCGPIGLLVQKFAWQLGAKRVIAVDCVDARLDYARKQNDVEAFDFTKVAELHQVLYETTKGGADVVIDCVGMDGKRTVLESIETVLRLQGGSMGAIQMASQVVRKGGTVQLVGVYGLRYNAFPLGDFFARNVTLKMGQASVIHLLPELYSMLQKGTFDASGIITHRYSLKNGADAYRLFQSREDGCIKTILLP